MSHKLSVSAFKGKCVKFKNLHFTHLFYTIYMPNAHALCRIGHGCILTGVDKPNHVNVRTWVQAKSKKIQVDSQTVCPAWIYCLYAQNLGQEKSLISQAFQLARGKLSVLTWDCGADGQNRTGNLRITSALLYRWATSANWYKFYFERIDLLFLKKKYDLV